MHVILHQLNITRQGPKPNCDTLGGAARFSDLVAFQQDRLGGALDVNRRRLVVAIVDQRAGFIFLEFAWAGLGLVGVARAIRSKQQHR